MGGKNFETGVYSYNKFIKKNNIWIHLQVVRDKKKSGIKHGRLFFFFQKLNFWVLLIVWIWPTFWEEVTYFELILLFFVKSSQPFPLAVSLLLFLFHPSCCLRNGNNDCPNTHRLKRPPSFFLWHNYYDLSSAILNQFPFNRLYPF